MLEPWQAMLLIVTACGLLFLGMRWTAEKLWPMTRPAPSVSHHAYDKAKYHSETIEEFGLPDERAGHLGTFFLSWLIKRNLISPTFQRRARRQLAKYQAGKMSIQRLYFEQDSCLVSDMLSDEGNSFAMAYFDLLHGQYIHDYVLHLQKDLPSEFHVEYTPENERAMHDVIDRRYSEWQQRGSAPGAKQ